MPIHLARRTGRGTDMRLIRHPPDPKRQSPIVELGLRSDSQTWQIDRDYVLLESAASTIAFQGGEGTQR